MGRAVVNVSQSQRLQQADFSESKTDLTLGPPVKAPTVNGESIEAEQVQMESVNQWVSMTTADQGLLDSIYNFINTTKDGVSVSPDTTGGRTKKMIFNFYGNIGKSIMPGEIGQFEVNFSYPAKTKLGTSVSTSPSPVTVSNANNFTATNNATLNNQS
jgi:hypothetical protein